MTTFFFLSKSSRGSSFRHFHVMTFSPSVQFHSPHAFDKGFVPRARTETNRHCESVLGAGSTEKKTQNYWSEITADANGGHQNKQPDEMNLTNNINNKFYPREKRTIKMPPPDSRALRSTENRRKQHTSGKVSFPVSSSVRTKKKKTNSVPSPGSGMNLSPGKHQIKLHENYLTRCR